MKRRHFDCEHVWKACRRGLRELGYVKGTNILFEPRQADGRHERLPELAAELVRPKVDVIVAAATPASRAAKLRLPVMYGYREFVDGGGLMSQGPDRIDHYRRTASYVARILQGAQPGSLPIEQPTNFELVINLKTAKALGLTISQSLLQRADPVIQ